MGGLQGAVASFHDFYLLFELGFHPKFWISITAYGILKYTPTTMKKSLEDTTSAITFGPAEFKLGFGGRPEDKETEEDSAKEQEQEKEQDCSAAQDEAACAL